MWGHDHLQQAYVGTPKLMSCCACNGFASAGIVQPLKGLRRRSLGADEIVLIMLVQLTFPT
jgi:hypothetical protein